MFDDLLGALKQGVLNALQQKTGIDLGAAPEAGESPGPDATAARPAGAPAGPEAATDPLDLSRRHMPSGETLDAVLPTQVGEFSRSRVNDRFGGIRSGGVFAGYRGGGVEVRVLVTLLRSAEAARQRVREAAAPAGDHGGVAPVQQSLDTEPSFSFAPGSAVWSRGPYCFSASSSDTDGDIALPPRPDQIAALDRFMRAFPY